MRANTRCLVMAAFLSGGAYAQAIMEHAAAAAGASVGTLGGKVLSNTLDKTLSKAADVTADAAAAKKPDKKAATVTATSTPPAATSSEASSTSTPGEPKRARVARPPTPRPVFADAGPSRSAPALALAPPPSIEDFAKVKEGGARQDVLAALGTPSSHITIPDDGHLIEILSYWDGRRRLGSVRLDNGEVVSVSVAP